MTELRAEGAWVRDMMQAALELPVAQHDDGSLQGMHDLNITLDDGTRASVEVTSAVDGDSLALWKRVNGRDERWQVDGLRGGWWVELKPHAHGKTVLRDLPNLLRDLERLGVPGIDVRRRPHRVIELHEAAYRLGVVRARQGATDFPGSIYVTINLPSYRTGGMVPVTGQPLCDWLSRLLADDSYADVLAKLSRSGAAERHAFIILPGFTSAPFAVTDLLMRDDAPLPEVAPDLPREVTHVWVASTWSSGHGMRWSPLTGWSGFSKLTQAGAHTAA